jgi:uncharacterized protein
MRNNLLVLLLAAAPAAAADAPRPRVAVVIDDFGLNYKKTPPDAEWAKARVPVTWAVMPESPKTKQAAAAALEAGAELIIHFPFDPFLSLELPKDSLSPADAEKIAKLLEKAFSQIPKAVGLNNHRSYKATRNAPLMREFMRLYEPRGLYFLDSKVSEKSIAYAEARAAGVRAARNAVFLDTAELHTKEFCVKILRQAASRARREGEAIAIGHHYFRTTLDCVNEEGPRLAAAGVDFVFASALAR